MCPGNGSTVCLLGLPVNCAGWLRGMAATGEPWSGLNVKRTARVDGSTEKRKQELAALSTSSSCLIDRQEPTIKKLPVGETS
jgi:hypothetical protein